MTLTLPVPQAPDWVDAEECHRCRVQFGVVTRKVSVPPGAAPRPPAVAVRPLHPLEVLSLLAVTSWWWWGGGAKAKSTPSRAVILVTEGS